MSPYGVKICKVLTQKNNKMNKGNVRVQRQWYETVIATCNREEQGLFLHCVLGRALEAPTAVQEMRGFADAKLQRLWENTVILKGTEKRGPVIKLKKQK